MGLMLVGAAVLILAATAFVGSIMASAVVVRESHDGEAWVICGGGAMLLSATGVALTGIGGALIGWWPW